MHVMANFKLGHSFFKFLRTQEGTAHSRVLFSDSLLVLHDHRVAKLHVLDVPTAFLLENFESLSIREDKDMVSLELSSEESRFLENVRPQTSGLCFASFLVNSVSVV